MATTTDSQAPRRRNKLRKQPKQRPGSLISSSASPRPSTDTAGTEPPPEQQGSHGWASALLPPPDLSDAKWEGFVRASGYVLPMQKSPRLEQVGNAAVGSPPSSSSSPPPAADPIIPEFAHLAATPAVTATTSTATTSSSSSPSVRGLQPPDRSPRRPLSDGSRNTRVPSLRSHSSSSTSAPLSSPSSSFSSANGLRRYAKTPVLRIGQLEEEEQQQRQQRRRRQQQQQQQQPTRTSRPPPVPPVPRRSARRASAAEQIAAQYRSLLESRSCARLRPDGDYYYDGEAEARGDEDPSAARQGSIETIRSAIARRGVVVTPPSSSSEEEDDSSFSSSSSSPSSTSSPSSSSSSLDFPEASAAGSKGSPTSEGTLVGFEEDAIYFKPAFTLEGLSPIPEDDSSFYTPPDSPRTEVGGAGDDGEGSDDAAALSLQICVDLLGKELASVMEQRQQNDGDISGDGNSQDKSAEGAAAAAAAAAAKTPTSPLQIWLMIEAYERLRDQMTTEATNNLSPSDAQSLEAMFDTWLKALYRVHEDITLARPRVARAGGVPDEREVEALSTVDLD